MFGTNPAGDRVRRPGHQRGRGRRRPSAGRSRAAPAAASTSTGTGPGRVRAKITEHGWTAEFAIPFRTLRYPSATSQTWGINFQRNIRRAQRARLLGADSPAVQPVSGCRWPVRSPACRRRRCATCAITPYVLGNALASGQKPVDADLLGDIGGDSEVQPDAEPDARRARSTPTSRRSKWTISRSTSIASRCSFPEKRPFFLENAGFFSGRQPGRGRPVLQPAHRHQRRRARRFRSSAAAASRARPASSTSACSTCRPTTIERSGRQHELQRRARQPRPAEPLVDWRASSPTAQGVGDLSRATPIPDRTYGVDGKWGIGQTTDAHGVSRRRPRRRA